MKCTGLSCCCVQESSRPPSYHSPDTSGRCIDLLLRAAWAYQGRRKNGSSRDTRRLSLRTRDNLRSTSDLCKRELCQDLVT